MRNAANTINAGAAALALAFGLTLTMALPGQATEMTLPSRQPGIASGGVSPAVAVGTAFTYQGRLEDGGAPASGPYDFQFMLMDAASGGVQIGSTVVVDNAAVSGGVFTVALDFGQDAFGGGARWLEIGVRPGAGGTYTPLTPRQALTPAPLALGLPNVFVNNLTGFVGVGRSDQLSLNEKFGVEAVVGPNTYGGMYINTDDVTGWPFYGYATGGSFRAWTYFDGAEGNWKLYNGGDRLIVPSGGGLEIASTSQPDGLRINRAADDGVQIGNGVEYPNYGVFIPSPGVSSTCLLVSTAAPSGNYALYTADNIEAGTVTLASQQILVRADGAEALMPGDVVVAAGMAEPLTGGSARLALVQRAGRDEFGVIGVVASRMEWQVAPGKESEGERILLPAEGPARAGDYVSLVTLGVAEVRVQGGAAIAKGARLTASGGEGGVRPLRVESLNGMAVSEGAPTIGVALADARGNDVVPVFVNIH